MKQLPLPGIPPVHKIVNIASVKHRSPFRYPGGKTWLVPHIYAWLGASAASECTFVEPFAGGAIVGLSVAFEELAKHIILVELDEQVAAVWQAVIQEEQGLWLAAQIMAFDPTPDNVAQLLARPGGSLSERAFQTIVKNRVNRGGILARGAGRLKNGDDGRGLRSRWYPETLARRIHDIHAIKARLQFVHGDGLNVINAYSQYPNAIFFVDPPYTASPKKPGSRLYDYAELDHENLFALLATVKGDFLMTYENVGVIRQLAAKYHFDIEPIPMKNTHHAQLTELLIGRDLSWIRG